MFGKIKSYTMKVAGIAAAVVTAAVSNASAMDWTGISFSTSDIDSAMPLIIGGLVVMWGLRKVIKTVNRS